MTKYSARFTSCLALELHESASGWRGSLKTDSGEHTCIILYRLMTLLSNIKLLLQLLYWANRLVVYVYVHLWLINS